MWQGHFPCSELIFIIYYTNKWLLLCATITSHQKCNRYLYSCKLYPNRETGGGQGGGRQVKRMGVLGMWYLGFTRRRGPSRHIPTPVQLLCQGGCLYNPLGHADDHILIFHLFSNFQRHSRYAGN